MKKIYQLPIYFLVFCYVLLKEVFWTALAEPITEYVKKLAFFQFVETKILSKLNSYMTLIFFLMIFVFVEIIGVYSLAFFAKGSIIIGVALYISKIPLASFAFWIYRVKEADLNSIKWFAFVVKWIKILIHKITDSSYYINTKNMITSIKEYIKTRKSGFIIKFTKSIYKRQLKKQSQN